MRLIIANTKKCVYQINNCDGKYICKSQKETSLLQKLILEDVSSILKYVYIKINFKYSNAFLLFYIFLALINTNQLQEMDTSRLTMI